MENQVKAAIEKLCQEGHELTFLAAEKMDDNLVWIAYIPSKDAEKVAEAMDYIKNGKEGYMLSNCKDIIAPIDSIYEELLGDLT